ncbi:MAG: TolC family protein [Terriglobales bacterium]
MRWLSLALLGLGLSIGAAAQAGGATIPPPLGPALTLDQALQLAQQHSPALAAARENIPQSKAEEVTASLRPNPVLAWDALFVPLFDPHDFNSSYLNNSTEFDASVGYTIERGHKRQARMRAAREATTVVQEETKDSLRGLDFAVAQAYLAALLAKSSLQFARQDLASWQNTVQISQDRYRAGAISLADLDAIKLQQLQFQTTVTGAQLALQQARTQLEQQVGMGVLANNFTLAGSLQFQPVQGNLEDMKLLALKDRPDLQAARAGILAAQGQHQLAMADGKRDLTTTAQYTHVSAANNIGFLFSIDIPVFDRNQGEIARTAAATVQAEDIERAANDQVLADVATAYQAVQQGASVVKLYTSGYRTQAQQALTIRQYAYKRGASSLLDLLDAERTYRSTELGYRQAVATYMLAVEQLKEAVGTRSLP